MKMKKLKERFKIWIIHKCGGKFPYEYTYDRKMNIVRMERPFVHLKHSMLIVILIIVMNFYIMVTM